MKNIELQVQAFTFPIVRVAVCAAAILSFVTSCENANLRARDKGALAGGTLGAGLGAIVGNQVGSAGAGVAIGSAIGALSGALVGNEIDNQDDAIADREKRLDAQDREINENRKLLEELRGKGIDAKVTSRGLVMNIPDVLFEFDSSKLGNGARHTVGEIADVVNRSKNRKISVEGHTDSVGSLDYNQDLSERRARSVAEALSSTGDPRSRMKVRGFGETKPVASNSSESGRQRNRRVEVILENN